MTEIVSLIAALAVVVVGILVMLQVATPADIGRYAARAVLVILTTILGWYLLKVFWTSVLVPWLEAGLASLKALLTWLIVTLIGLIALLLAARLAVRRFQR
jgi:hypothetical protein